MQQPERSAQVFRELRGLGVRLAIDDFGTGYSSLSYLQQLPAAILKIDRSFLTSLDQGPNGATLVRGIIGLANGLGLITVAEGIETRGAGHDPPCAGLQLRTGTCSSRRRCRRRR